MVSDLGQRAKDIISKIIYITIATVSDDGQPWNSPVYSAFDENYTFYWASYRENRHSQNIRANPKVAIVIYDSTVAHGTGEGVYASAKATELVDQKEIEHAIGYLYGRKNKEPRPASDFLNPSPRRVYKAVPQQFWINGTEHINGQPCDIRKEVKLN